MSGPRVLISGGGIAGPALAHLLRAYGFRPTIVERAPEVRAGGHGIQIDGVGIDALRRPGGRAAPHPTRSTSTTEGTGW
jgi:2-polyprenyl-6-methoxyphenol hydroxylase-like FAD-dependent oxidoreductase